MIAILLLLVAGAPVAASPRFAADNAALGAPLPGEHRVVFLGDSITSGWARFGGDYFNRYHHVGRGIAGETSAGMRARLADDVLALHPEVVHILAGTNDIAGNGGPVTMAETEANIAAMAAAAQAAGAHVILGAVLPTLEYPWHPGQQPAGKIRDLNRWLQAEAAAHGYVYADYYTPLATPDGGLRPELTADGVHPNLAGYQLMTPIAEAAIRAALAAPQRR